jgi:hypothetical protein
MNELSTFVQGIKAREAELEVEQARRGVELNCVVRDYGSDRICLGIPAAADRFSD